MLAQPSVTCSRSSDLAFVAKPADVGRVTTAPDRARAGCCGRSVLLRRVRMAQCGSCCSLPIRLPSRRGKVGQRMLTRPPARTLARDDGALHEQFAAPDAPRLSPL